MSDAERKRLTDYPFLELWKDLWVDEDHRIFKNVFDKASAQFERIQPQLIKYLNELTPTVNTPPWGFPKGKKNHKEYPLDCAFREFREETGMDIDKTTVRILNKRPIVDIYMGSNKRLYGTMYYVAYIDHILPIKKVETQGEIRTEMISNETGDLRWVTLENAAILLGKRGPILRCVTKILEKAFF
jgi:8-oxo-dGTP pyrophosphatase MutT (NUDIX family)